MSDYTTRRAFQLIGSINLDAEGMTEYKALKWAQQMLDKANRQFTERIFQQAFARLLDCNAFHELGAYGQAQTLIDKNGNFQALPLSELYPRKGLNDDQKPICKELEQPLVCSPEGRN